MSVLVDWQLRSLCEAGMLTPFDPALINPASVDVRLGPNLLIESELDDVMVPFSIAGCTQEAPFYLRPKHFVLAETLETFDVPKHVATQFLLKSSRAREGLQHLLAGWADPGFHGSKLTLELVNARRLHSIPLWPGMKIGQLVVHQLDDVPLRDYKATGRYNQRQIVTSSLGH